MEGVSEQISLSKILESSSVKEFKRALRSYPCRLCALCREGVYPTVSRGNEHAKVMLVGEAPGSQEIQTGLPFVGRAGKLLDQLLHARGIDANQSFYLSNICRCRPPDNRSPKPSEAQTCIHYLHKEIRLLSPRYILAMGQTSAKYLLGELIAGRKMADIVGQYFAMPKYETIQVFVLYHPAALLYNPKLLAHMNRHLDVFCRDHRSFVASW